MKFRGMIKNKYPALKKDGDLAELIGVILGDGHIRKYPRTEELSIFSNANNPGFIKRYSRLIEIVFGKKPKIGFHSNKKSCVRIRIYEKHIADRLHIPISPKMRKKIPFHRWISSSRKFMIRYLRGLYEAEGSFCVHRPTSTYKLFFSNINTSLLHIVSLSLKRLGFFHNLSGFRVQVSRKKEVYKLKKLLGFREY